jgi:type IV pilus assembly protein PilX
MSILPDQRRRNPHTQRGAVLFVSMIFLILLTLLALTATSTSILQERMTGGMRNRQLGLMGVESGLRGGEQYLWQLSASMVYDPANGASSGQPLPPCINATSTVADCAHVPYLGKLDASVQTFRSNPGWLNPSVDAAHPYTRTLTGLSGNLQTASIHAAPRFMVESLGLDLPASSGSQSGSIKPTTGQAGTHVLYRITARSQGGSDAVVRSAESVFSAADLTNAGSGLPGSNP